MELKEKLTAEIDKKHEYLKQIADGIIETCKDDLEYKNTVLKSKRTLTECFEHVRDKAYDVAKKGDGRTAMVRSDIVYTWCKEFYIMPDKEYEKLKNDDKHAEVAIKENKSTDCDCKKDSDGKKKETIKAPDRDIVTKKQKPEKKKQNDDNLDGQMDIFQFLK